MRSSLATARSLNPKYNANATASVATGPVAGTAIRSSQTHLSAEAAGLVNQFASWNDSASDSDKDGLQPPAISGKRRLRKAADCANERLAATVCSSDDDSDCASEADPDFIEDDSASENDDVLSFCSDESSDISMLKSPPVSSSSSAETLEADKQRDHEAFHRHLETHLPVHTCDVCCFQGGSAQIPSRLNGKLRDIKRLLTPLIPSQDGRVQLPTTLKEGVTCLPDGTAVVRCPTLTNT